MMPPKTLSVKHSKCIGVGIDPGYENCGICCMDLRKYKVLDYFTIETPRTEDLRDRLYLVHRELSLVINRPGVAVVGYESPYRVGKLKQKQRKSNYNPLILCRVAGYIESICWEREIPVYDFEPPDVKKAVMGPRGGSAEKSQVRDAVEKLTGFSMGEHEADAAATGYATARRYRLESRLRHLDA